HLHECSAGRLSEVIRRVRVLARLDVAVAVGRTGHTRIGSALVVTHGHSKPEGRMELEVPGPAGPGLIGGGRGVGRERQPVLVRISRAGLVRIEQERRLVVTRVVALSLVGPRIELLRAQLRMLNTERLAVRGARYVAQC